MVWHTEGGPDSTGRIRATSGGVVLGSVSHYARYMYDPLTGEERGKVTAEGIDVSLGDDVYVSGYYGSAIGVTPYDDEDGWGHTVRRNVSRAVIGGDTVYVYFKHHTEDPEDTRSEELVAFDKDEGSENWSLSKEELPVGEVRAISGDTLYVEHDDHEGEGLVALREETDEDGDDGDEDDQQEDDDGQEDRDGESDDEGSEGDNADGADDEAEFEGGEAGDDGGTDDGSEDDDGTDDDTELGDDDETDDEADDGATDDEEDADGVPGFTTGAGLLGGALGLEWLRRQAEADDRTE